MIFTTLKFIVFMMMVFTLYYIIPKKKQWVLLLIASYIFYFNASFTFPLVLLAITVITYVFAVTVDKSYVKRDEYLSRMKYFTKEEKDKYMGSVSQKLKPLFIVLLFLELLTLCVFKYADFIFNNVLNIYSLLGRKTFVNEVSLNIIMPLGISFYVFQSLGYCIDVYMGTVKAERNFLKHALFISFFPTLLQGPIEGYEHLSAQLFRGGGVQFSYKNAKYGLQRIVWGFLKKLVVANQISLITDDIWINYNSYNGFIFWIFILVLYSLWIYSDFSGYMDIAIGCAEMLGIKLTENFETPYFSKSIAQFWRKWHITLGLWFKNYVFYPMLRIKFCENFRKKYRRKNKYISKLIPNIIALLVVWILIGFWHGADWKFVLYGLFHGGIIIFSTILAPLYSRLNKKFSKLTNSKIFNLFRILRTFMLVTIGFLLFKALSLKDSFVIFNKMLAGTGVVETIKFIDLNLKNLFEIGIGVVLLFFVEIYHYKNNGISVRDRVSGYNTFVRWSIYIGILLIILIFGAYGTSGLNQFAYFRF